MRTEQITSKTEVVEYDSLQEFYQYLVSTPFNEAFCWASHSSVEGDKWFTKTKDFSEAVELFRNGWSDMATKLVQKLKVIESKTEPTMKPRNTLSVCGYQAIVPLYLQGVPNNMVNKKMVPVKQKVITLNKSIDYHGGVDADDMYTGRMVLDQATLDRFAIIEFDYCLKIEMAITKNNTELVEFIHQMRKEAESKGIRATFSYRCMTMITKLERKGMNLEMAMKISIVKGLDKDTINTFNPSGNTKYHNALRKIQLAA